MKRLELLDEVDILLAAARGACLGHRHTLGALIYREAVRLAQECRRIILNAAWYEVFWGLGGRLRAAFQRFRYWVKLVLANA